jgi:hypothetical protein
VYDRTLLPKREPKRPIGLSCMEMLSVGPQAAIRTTLKMSAVSQWCPSVRNESCLFLSSDFSTSFSSETYLFRPCFSVVFALFDDLRLPLSPAGLSLCPEALKPARHCPLSSAMAESSLPRHRQAIRSTLSSPNDVIPLRAFSPGFAQRPRPIVETQLATSTPSCDNYLFQAPRRKADAPDSHARSYGGNASDAKGQWVSISICSCPLARSMHHSGVSHAERVARSDPTGAV